MLWFCLQQRLDTDNMTEKKMNMGVDELMMSTREETNKKLELCVARKDRFGDIGFLVKTTQALIGANKEIWQRCLGSENRAGKGNFVFERVGFTKIQARTWPSGYYRQHTLKVEAIPVLVRKDFGKPPKFPSQLATIIAPSSDSDGIFMDYDEYLKIALLLNVDTLLPFLSVLKNHLEDVQIFLGAIDGWLMETSICVDYIVDNFKTCRERLEPPSVTGCDSLSCRVDHTGLACLVCGQMYVPGHYDQYGRYVHQLPCSGQSTFHSYFHACPVYLTDFSTSGNHYLTFDIAQKTEQDKLQRFLDFVQT